MHMFFIVGASLLWILSILLVYSSKRVEPAKKHSTNLTAILSFIIGLVSFFIGIMWNPLKILWYGFFWRFLVPNYLLHEFNFCYMNQLKKYWAWNWTKIPEIKNLFFAASALKNSFEKHLKRVCKGPPTIV